jgi:hypothetical protein
MSTTLTKPPVFAVCLTRQELSAVRSALREYLARLTSTGEPYAYYHMLGYEALQKVHAILLDAGGVDDTK